MTLDTLDPSTSFEAQLGQKTKPTTLLSLFVVPPQVMTTVLELCAADLRFMAEQPGFVSARIQRGTGGSKVLLQIVEWTSTEALAAAVAAAGADPTTRERSARMPPEVTAYLHVFETAALVQTASSDTAEGDRR